jgi:hypothetical protein
MRSTVSKIIAMVLLTATARAFDAAPMLSFFSPPTDAAWAPPANCILWLEADSGVTLSGSSVVTWTDKSGAGNHATNSASTATNPTNIINGYPSIRFNGTNSWLRSPANPGVSAHTIIFVANRVHKGAVIDGYYPEMSYFAGASDNGSPHFLKGETSPSTAAAYPIYSSGGSYDGAGSYAWGTWYMFALPLSTGAWTAWKNGASEGTSSASAYSAVSTGLTLGSHTTAGRYWPGDIAAVLVFSRKLSNSEVNNVQAYLSTKYGISVSQLP